MRRTYRSLILLASVLSVPLLLPITHALAKGPGARPAPPTCPTFSASNFSKKSTTIDNPYFPLEPGTRFTYQGTVKKAPVRDEVYVTHNTPTIDGVVTVEVLDQVWESDVPTESTLDWYAQDDQGNVWYFGESATQLPAGTYDCSWNAGDDGAPPRYAMEASPQGRDPHCQENGPGVAQAH